MSQFIEMFKNIPSVKIADCCITVSGGTPNTKKIEYYDGGDIPWLSSGEINQGYIFSTDKYITQLGLENSSAKWVPANSVVIAMYGATAGKVGFIKIPLTTNQAVCTLLPNDGFEPLYLYYATLSKTSWMISQCRGAAQPNISQSIIRSMEIPMATIDEQKRFCKLLTQADKSKFGDFKSQFIEMTTRSELNKKSIGEIAEVRTGSTPSRRNPEYWNGTHYWVSAQDMGNKYIYDTLEKITDKGYATCKVVPAGSILYVCRGSIGVMSINTMDCATNQSICTATCKTGYNTEYLYYALKVAEKAIKKQGIGTSFKSLNQSAFASIEILFPAIEIQDKFATIAKQADKSKSYVWIALKNLESMLGYYIRQVA